MSSLGVRYSQPGRKQINQQAPVLLSTISIVIACVELTVVFYLNT